MTEQAPMGGLEHRGRPAVNIAERRASAAILGRDPVRPPRCIEVLQAWRELYAAPRHRRAPLWGQRSRPSRAKRHGDWRDHYDIVTTGRGPGEQALPRPLLVARRNSVGEGAERAALRTHRGLVAMEAGHLAGERARLLVRLEYARIRSALLLDVPPARLDIFCSETTRNARASGVAYDEPAPAPAEAEAEPATRPAEIHVQLSADWLWRIYWQARAVVDGRLILDVIPPSESERPSERREDPDDPRPAAVLINWASRQSATDSTDTPGELDTTWTPLDRDATGRWRLADPLEGTRMRRYAPPRSLRRGGAGVTGADAAGIDIEPSPQRPATPAPDQGAAMRYVNVAYSITRAERADGWWVRLTTGNAKQDHGPYPDEDAAIAATSDLITALEGGPFEREPTRFLPDQEEGTLRGLLDDALDGVPLGAYDRRILHWLAGWDASTVVTIAGWIRRARQHERDQHEQDLADQE